MQGIKLCQFDIRGYKTCPNSYDHLPVNQCLSDDHSLLPLSFSYCSYPSPLSTLLPPLLISSNMTFKLFIATGFVRNRSTPLLNASCLALGFAAPVKAINAVGGKEFSRSKRRILREDSMPSIIGMEMSVFAIC